MLKLFTLILAIVFPIAIQAQTVLYTENFETGGASISLNTTDVSSTTAAENPWIINNVYTGGSGTFPCLSLQIPFTVPAGPQQPAGITNNPTSFHLHITPQIAINSGGSVPAASYVAADGFCIFGGQNSFSKMNMDVSTIGYDSIVFDHWWACGGSSTYYGELYYSTNSGSTWTVVNNPANGTTQWRGELGWVNTKLSVPAWANKATLRFGFRFVAGATATGSELDPGYDLDDISITGYVLCTTTTSTISETACDSYTSPSGQVWTSSNTYMDTIPNANSCDSIITINLTINNSSSTISETACNSYTSPSGQIWTSSNTYMDTIPNANSCDSVITISLTITTIDTGIVALLNSGLMSTDTNSLATFQWIDCNNSNAPIVGETANTFFPSMPGDYAVIVTANGCSDTSACIQVIGVGLSLIDNSSNWKLFPNPTTGNLTLDFGVICPNPTISIFNALGQLIQEHTPLSTQRIELNIQGATGIYSVRIKTETGDITTLKVIKQ